MENLIKKPYEISLWEDHLIWHRKRLEPIPLSESEYQPGKFYSQNKKAFGLIPYTLDYEIYNEGKRYFKLSEDDDRDIKGPSAESINITDDIRPNWTEKNLYSVVIVQEWDNDETYYTFNNSEGDFIEINKDLNPTPDQNKIYYIKQEDDSLVPNVVFQYYDEQKIAIIGSNTMDAPIRAVSPKLVSNVNGSNTLTFSMYSHYYDEEQEVSFANPFLKLLVNERKVKLRYGALGEDNTKWYDFVVKNIQENSDTKTYTYTCKDLFINELSKSGFDLVLDAELENNIGNVEELAEVILEESDWQLGEENSNLIQTKEEPLYEIVLNRDITATNMKDSNEEIDISSGSIIYGFYTPIMNQESYFQFLYRQDGKYEIDDDHVITNSENWFIEKIEYDEIEGKPDIAESINISEKYRGDRLIRQQKTIYDSTIDKYVQVYENDEKEIVYGYSESEYVSPASVSNYVTNSNSFTSTTGWKASGIVVEAGAAPEFPTFELASDPDIKTIPYENLETTEFRSFLKYSFDKNRRGLIFNSGFSDSRSQINNIAAGEVYCFRIKCGVFRNGQPESTAENVIYKITAGEYVLDNGVYDITDTIFEVRQSAFEKEDDWFYANAQCTKSLNYSSLINKKLGIFIEFEPSNGASFYIEDFQFFPFVRYVAEDGTSNFVKPGDNLVSYVKTKYYIYTPNPNYQSIDDVNFIYKGDEPSEDFIPVYNDRENGFEKVRSITASESNRFNLIQELCETFECWAKFTIEHNENTGEILLDENFRQKKWITFHEFIGKENYAGFKYGINLKSIQRTLDSEAIVSKLVVKNNANEFANNGFCSISRSSENPSGENFIYDFSYYIQQGLLTYNIVSNDLYLDANGYLGYYKKLRAFNTNRDLWIEEQARLLIDVSKYEANYQTYKTSVESAQEELRETYVQIENMTGYTYQQMVLFRDYKGTETNWPYNETQTQEAQNWWNKEEFISLVTKLAQLLSKIRQHTQLRDQSQQLFEQAKNRAEELKNLLNELTNQKRALNLQFYKKYSRFIQEGSWINEDYVDDNLYYLDAASTLYTSAHPKVSYTINVLELSQLEDYQNYSFELGDKTYMEDTEFFGWVWKDGAQTPYHEEIVVSEITLELDSPEKNTIKAQNYKTQFEDLFQRITATTQSLDYHTGEYTKVAGVVNSNGTINTTTLQNSLLNNALILENARDQSVVWDETGITTTNLSKPNELVRLVSGGLFLSIDGGVTWSTGITGGGINTAHLTAGSISTDKIMIMNGGFPSFKWDTHGINAYSFGLDGNKNPTGFNFTTAVRFDQYGIYGISGIEDFVPENESHVWENANYALTWKGFMLKNDDGSVRITSNKDIQVLDKEEKERIKIGRIGQNNNEPYGIRISNAKSEPVMETDDLGELWLKNRLRIGTNDTSTVEIGYLNNVRGNSEVHEVIHAGAGDSSDNKDFIVYEDGQVKANYIEVLGGKIGNMNVSLIEEMLEPIKRLDITSDLGFNFKISKNPLTIIPETINLKLSSVGFVIDESKDVKWEISRDCERWMELTSTGNLNYSLTYENFISLVQIDVGYLKATVQSTEGDSYSSQVMIMAIKDGSDISGYVIETNQDEILKFMSKDEDGDVFWRFSPNILEIEIFKQPKNENAQPVLLTRDNFKIELNSIDLENFITFPSEDNEITKVNFNIQSLYDSDNFRTQIENEQGYFKIIYKDEEDNEIASKILPYKNGTSNDMAQFSINATGINASIQNSKLSFDANGLTIFGAGIKIYKNIESKNEIPNFYADEDGNLHLTGIINAESGSFKGDIQALSGEIGGFKIENNTLCSTEGENPSLILYGKEGKIQANRITLGQGATIERYIELGDAKLYNPNANADGKVLESGGIVLRQDGTMSLGEISISKDDRGNYFIKDNSSKWKISASGRADFDEIYANNLHIQNSIMEIGTVQSLGSLMIVKDAWEIVEIRSGEGKDKEDTILKLDLKSAGTLNLKQGDYVLGGQKSYKVIDTKPIGQDGAEYKFAEITLNVPFESNGDVITKLGEPNEDSVLSLLGQENTNNFWGFASSNAITIADLRENLNSNSLEYHKSLILGKLPEGGNGLYAENVQLYGSLTTLGNDIYAGINTKSEAESKFITQDAKEKIIIFAGANENTKKAIEDAPFYVTNHGSIYASKGLFEGAIISKGEISGSIIRAPKIYGTGEEEQPALTIYGTTKGISFKTEAEDEEDRRETLSLSTDGFSVQKEYFVEFEKDGTNKAIFKGKQIQVDSVTSSSNVAAASMSLTNNGIYFNSEIQSSLEISDSKITNKKNVYMCQDIYFGENGEQYYVQAKDASGAVKGYDLYVK